MAMMIGCGGGDKVPGAVKPHTCSGGAGHWFILIFVVIPVIVGLVKLFRESEATSDSLISIEGQLRRLNNKLDDLEAKQSGGAKKE